jgi:hypothetical protein
VAEQERLVVYVGVKDLEEAVPARFDPTTPMREI